jgi:hypothetical protein
MIPDDAAGLRKGTSAQAPFTQRARMKHVDMLIRKPPAFPRTPDALNNLTQPPGRGRRWGARPSGAPDRHCVGGVRAVGPHPCRSQRVRGLGRQALGQAHRQLLRL